MQLKKILVIVSASVNYGLIELKYAVIIAASAAITSTSDID